MARKCLSGLSYGFLTNCPKKINLCNSLFSFRRYSKKEYSYDLDSLIEWNKDTTLAFGSPVKLTKTGKISKSRKKIPDEHLAHSLEALNAISASVVITHNHNDVYDNKNIPVKSHKPRNGKVEKTVSDKDIPDDCFEDIVPDYSDPLHASSRSDLPVKIPHKEMTEDGIFIPEIKPVPQHTSNIKVNTHRKSKFQQSDPTNNFDLEKMTGSVPSSKIGLYNTEPKLFLIREGSGLELIPESGKCALETDSTNLKTGKPTLKADSSSSQFNLPVEPPQSFSLITEFPLTFDQEENVIALSSKMQAFKTDVEKLGLRSLPSVKSILNRTMPELNRFFLNRWREGMVKELGEQGFKLHQEATIKRGINMHANIMEFLSGKPMSEIQVMPDNEGHWASLQSAMSLIGDVKALEADVRHPFLIYRGVFDCIAKYKDLLCIVDWKTSKKPRPLLKNTYDDPLQITAYVGAVNATNANDNHAQKINHGVIVVAYPDGSPAHIHMMNRTQCEHYWHDWTERLYNYYQLVYTSKFG